MHKRTVSVTPTCPGDASICAGQPSCTSRSTKIALSWILQAASDTSLMSSTPTLSPCISVITSATPNPSSCTSPAPSPPNAPSTTPVPSPIRSILVSGSSSKVPPTTIMSCSFPAPSASSPTAASFNLTATPDNSLMSPTAILLPCILSAAPMASPCRSPCTAVRGNILTHSSSFKDSFKVSEVWTGPSWKGALHLPCFRRMACAAANSIAKSSRISAVLASDSSNALT